MSWTGILAKLESICHAYRRHGNYVGDIAGLIECIRNSPISSDLSYRGQLGEGYQGPQGRGRGVASRGAVAVRG
jgi:hypothetical protein